ncbi:hypothetical protein OGAPHI_000761 [Ogataea philodendri]|uniref:Cap-associated protein CAF20 n=1 Tax=Ogataea philodendri TaxID=1378263 RepID=A0A9P8PGD0_9ASCO|nr:uncharacterized protein OGAPHI_000761 [Ogataea philodendri]KAH3671050.1 hypothetical protein OGAPHI_000761 [Ogataea philodendri]
MVRKYTEEELFSYQSQGVLPEGIDLTSFVQLVDEVREALRDSDEQGPRRRSFTGYKKRQPKELKQTDDDGWTSFVTPKPKKTVVEDKPELKQHTLKLKTTSNKISSGKGSTDSRDTIAITQVSKFNAFDALNDEDEAVESDEEYDTLLMDPFADRGDDSNGSTIDDDEWFSSESVAVVEWPRKILGELLITTGGETVVLFGGCGRICTGLLAEGLVPQTGRLESRDLTRGHGGQLFQAVSLGYLLQNQPVKRKLVVLGRRKPPARVADVGDHEVDPHGVHHLGQQLGDRDVQTGRFVARDGFYQAEKQKSRLLGLVGDAALVVRLGKQLPVCLQRVERLHQLEPLLLNQGLVLRTHKRCNVFEVQRIVQVIEDVDAVRSALVVDETVAVGALEDAFHVGDDEVGELDKLGRPGEQICGIDRLVVDAQHLLDHVVDLVVVVDMGAETADDLDVSVVERRGVFGEHRLFLETHHVAQNLLDCELSFLSALSRIRKMDFSISLALPKLLMLGSRYLETEWVASSDTLDQLASLVFAPRFRYVEARLRKCLSNSELLDKICFWFCWILSQKCAKMVNPSCVDDNSFSCTTNVKMSMI